MAATRRPFGPLVDDKKHDILTRHESNSPTSLFRSFRTIRRRRVLLSLFGLWIVYLFVKNIPTDVPPVSQRYDPRYGRLHPGSPDQYPNQQAGQPLRLPENQSQAYAGPIRYLNLAKSFRGFGFFRGVKDNILFAVSDLHSASQVVVAACTMAQQNKTDIHVAAFGRKGLLSNEILAVNGIADSDCPVTWHDARPDFSEESTEDRLQHSASAAFGHLHAALRFQAVFAVDDSSGRMENERFLRTIKSKATELGIPLIPLPANGKENVPWILTLDGQSLRMWHDVQVEIIIRAVPESSASLLRLLRSIQNADYTGLSHPRLTIELPAKPDQFLLDRLAGFSWPPGAPVSESKLTLRRYIDGRHFSPALSSVRTLESFYPIASTAMHVLMLSPNVELAQNYYQFLVFSLLEFKYGSKTGQMLQDVLGLSLELPKRTLHETPMSSPTTGDIGEPFILWQAPASNAALYFGDKWLELHSFLSRRLATDPDLSLKITKDSKLSQDHPIWLSPALELMQGRGYFMLYPVIGDKSSPIATVHKDLFQKPEEYENIDSEKSKPDLKDTKDTQSKLSSGAVLTAPIEGEDVGSAVSMTSASAFTSNIKLRTDSFGRIVWPEISNLALFSHEGVRLTWPEEVRSHAATYAQDFALSIGGCTSPTSLRNGVQGTELPLFCEPAIS